MVTFRGVDGASNSAQLRTRVSELGSPNHVRELAPRDSFVLVADAGSGVGLSDLKEKFYNRIAYINGDGRTDEEIQNGLNALRPLAIRLNEIEAVYLDDAVVTVLGILVNKPALSEDVRKIFSAMLIEGGFTLEQKQQILAKITEIHNSGNSNDAQKSAVKGVFIDLADSDKRDIFRLGAENVTRLADSTQEVVLYYVNRFTQLVYDRADGDTNADLIANDLDIERLYYDLADTYAGVRDDAVYEKLIDPLMTKWFEKPVKAILWHALMRVSSMDDTYKMDESGTAVDKPLHDAVLHAFIGKFTPDRCVDGDVDSMKLHASAVVATLAHNPWASESSSLQHIETDRYIDYMLEKGHRENETLTAIRSAILSALETVEISGFNLRAVVRTYLKLIQIESFRKDAILQMERAGAVKYSASYITDIDEYDDTDTLRKMANAFLVDTDPIDPDVPNSIAPIVKYGIKLISDAEKQIRDAHYAEITKLCEGTIEKLYKEYRLHHWIIEADGGYGLQTFFEYSEKDRLEHIDDTAGGSVSFATPAADADGWRFALGLDFLKLDNSLMVTGELGAYKDIADLLALKLMVEAGGFSIGKKEDDRDTTFAGALTRFKPELFLNFHRWKLGGGATLGLGAFLSVSAGAYFGKTNDKDPDTSDGDRKWHLGFSSEARAGLGFELVP